MTILGLCRHKLAIDTRCGITVLVTPYGPGHASRPKSAHYPITASGPVARVPGSDVDAAAQSRSASRCRPGSRRSVPAGAK